MFFQGKRRGVKESGVERDLPVTFSSPMVNLPVETSLAAAKDSSFRTGSVWETEMANLTLDFVYSWPGCYVWRQPLRSVLNKDHSFFLLSFILKEKKPVMQRLRPQTYINDRVIRQRRQTLIQSHMHLRRIALEELATPYQYHPSASSISFRPSSFSNSTRGRKKGQVGKGGKGNPYR